MMKFFKFMVEYELLGSREKLLFQRYQQRESIASPRRESSKSNPSSHSDSIKKKIFVDLTEKYVLFMQWKHKK